jgi:hypothetical protein
MQALCQLFAVVWHGFCIISKIYAKKSPRMGRGMLREAGGTGIAGILPTTATPMPIILQKKLK